MEEGGGLVVVRGVCLGFFRAFSICLRCLCYRVLCQGMGYV